MNHSSSCTVHSLAKPPDLIQTVTPITSQVPASTPSPLSNPDTGSSFHVGNLDASQTSNGSGIPATVYLMIHDVSEIPVYGVIVNGDWDKVSGNCTIGIDGFWNITLINLKKNISSDNTGVAKPAFGSSCQFSENRDANGNRIDRMNVVLEP